MELDKLIVSFVRKLFVNLLIFLSSKTSTNKEYRWTRHKYKSKLISLLTEQRREESTVPETLYLIHRFIKNSCWRATQSNPVLKAGLTSGPCLTEFGKSRRTEIQQCLWTTCFRRHQRDYRLRLNFSVSSTVAYSKQNQKGLTVHLYNFKYQLNIKLKVLEVESKTFYQHIRDEETKSRKIQGDYKERKQSVH